MNSSGTVVNSPAFANLLANASKILASGKPLSAERVKGDLNAQKAYLAKLLATENIRVEHSTSQNTASFRPEDRVLVLPIFKESMPISVYNMYVGHEVGHAIWTPPTFAEMLEKMAADRNLNLSGTLAMIYNIVEDCRIERRIIAKYPGLRRHFIAGYRTAVFDMNALGHSVSKLKWEETGFIDRFNIFFKSRGVLGEVPFTLKEMVFVERGKKLWDDEISAMELAFDIFAFLKDNSPKNSEPSGGGENGEGAPADETPEAPDSNEEDENFSPGEFDESDVGEECENSESDADGNDEEDEGDGGESNDEGSSAVGDDAETAEDSDEDSSGKGSGSSDEKNTNKSSGEGTSEDNAADSSSSPKGSKKSKPSKTREEGGDFHKTSDRGGAGKSITELPKITPGFDAEEEVCASEESFAETFKNSVDPNAPIFKTCAIPKIIKPLDWVVDHKTLLKEIRGEYPFDSAHLDAVHEMRVRQTPRVNYLANEFNRRKAATAYRKAAISTTGTLDTTKLHAYKYRDDIFKRITVEPNGKSHGLVMFVDWSCSMSGCIGSVMEEIIALVMFCKRVGISYRVFAFSSGYYYLAKRNHAAWSNRNLDSSQSRNPHDLQAGSSLALLELFSSKMSRTHFNMAIGGWSRFASDSRSSYGCGRMPNVLGMNSTPLNDAILVAHGLVPLIQEIDGYEVSNVVFLTDGDHCGSISHVGEHGQYKHGYFDYTPWSSDNASGKTTRTVRNPRSGKEYSLDLEADSRMTSVLLLSLKEETGCGLIGMFLMGRCRIQDIVAELDRSNTDPRLGALKPLYETTKVRKEKAKVFVEALKTDRGTKFPHAVYDAYFVMLTRNAGRSRNYYTHFINGHAMAKPRGRKPTKPQTEKTILKRKLTAISKEFKTDRKNIKAERLILSQFVDVIAKKV